MPLKDLQTKHLHLRKAHRSLAQSVTTILSDHRLYTFLPQEPPSLSVLQDRFKFWESGVSPDQSEDWLNWVLYLKDNQQAIGTLQAGIHRESKVATIAYMIGVDHQGLGYATEAVQALLAFLNMELQVAQCKAWIDTRNVASIRLVEKLGFTQVERIENADYFKGEQSDEYVYALNF